MTRTSPRLRHLLSSQAKIGLLAVVGLGLASCGADPDGSATTAPASTAPAAEATTSTPTGSTAPDEPDAPRAMLVASTTIWADVLTHITCTNLAEVTTIIPAGADSHTFEPSLRDRETLGAADLILVNGLDLEEGLLSTIEAVATEGVPVFAMADAMTDLLEGGKEESGDDHDHHDDHGHDDEHDEHDHATDPHIWFDPARVAAGIPALTAAILEATDLGTDPTVADQVTACAEDYQDQLSALDAEITSTLDTVPDEMRRLITNHGSLGYFADRYGFEIIGTVLGGSSSLAETNPAALEELAQTIIAAGLPAIFTEAETSARDIEALARRVGDLQVIALPTESLGAPGTATDTYIGFLRTTALRIAEALGE